jgi:hypothetical protein
MADALTWPAVVMGAFTVLNGSVLVPVVRAWRRNRQSGKQRDAVIEAFCVRMEAALRESDARNTAALREFGAQVLALNQSAWAHTAELAVLQLRVAHLERDVEREARRP